MTATSDRAATSPGPEARRAPPVARDCFAGEGDPTAELPLTIPIAATRASGAEPAHDRILRKHSSAIP
jgi:hypothetical protein